MAFSIEKRQGALPDIQRAYFWEVKIPELAFLTNGILSSDELVIRAQSVSIPQRGNEKIEVNFGPLRQYFPGRFTTPGTMTAVFMETEDQKILKGFTAWQNNITNLTTPLSDGTSTFANKRAIAKSMILNQYKFNGETNDTQVKLINAWPESVDEVALDYSNNDFLRVSVTFSYDFTVLERATNA